MQARLIPKARATTALMDTVDGIQIKPAVGAHVMGSRCLDHAI
jgi:hypothetical protein